MPRKWPLLEHVYLEIQVPVIMRYPSGQNRSTHSPIWAHPQCGHFREPLNVDTSGNPSMWTLQGTPQCGRFREPLNVDASGNPSMWTLQGTPQCGHFREPLNVDASGNPSMWTLQGTPQCEHLIQWTFQNHQLFFNTPALPM